MADAIIPTAHSHQRTFVLEVMGRHCGYLALVAGIVTEADFVFVPEWPPEEDWPDKLCRKLELEREAGQRLNIVIVSEGAIDREGNPITADRVKKEIVSRLDIDTRVTVLGHVQRGGAPTAFDRILGCRMGAESVMALVEATEDTEPCVVTLVGNVAVRVPLMKCVEKTQAVTKAMAEKNWELAIQLRGKSFCSQLQTFRLLSRLKPPADPARAVTGYRLAVINIGSPCCGMNAAVRSFTRNCLNAGHWPLGVRDGVEGLARGDVMELSWSDVSGWVVQGGSLLGTKRSLPRGKYQEIADTLDKFKIQGLVLIGGEISSILSSQHLDLKVSRHLRPFCSFRITETSSDSSESRWSSYQQLSPTTCQAQTSPSGPTPPSTPSPRPATGSGSRPPGPRGGCS